MHTRTFLVLFLVLGFAQESRAECDHDYIASIDSITLKDALAKYQFRKMVEHHNVWAQIQNAYGEGSPRHSQSVSFDVSQGDQKSASGQITQSFKQDGNLSERWVELSIPNQRIKPTLLVSLSAIVFSKERSTAFVERDLIDAYELDATKYPYKPCSDADSPIRGAQECAMVDVYGGGGAVSVKLTRYCK